MSMELRLPNITAQDGPGQLRQVRSYLYQLVQELNLCLSQEPLATAAPAPAQQPDPAQTFQSIKSLIIKSADVVQAYSDKIAERLEGLYVAQSDFGVYREETAQELVKTSQSLEQSFTSLNQILSQVEGIQDTVLGVNAYINSGLLCYGGDGAPVYGIEVGQRTEVDGVRVFQKFARFTSSSLSFYDANDNEVAYISDYKLHITDAQITGSCRMGHLVDLVQSDGSVVTKCLAGG